ncbi:PREDICTED: defensin-like protein 195 [Tarenaya hassleriana]|uniref:defensin-like protein 195 n=1 Tax=Tarenaya hassleriana TaxID=28532 RepID=UPI00053C4814|nr:PREDICTED: defensin-like protein 195 [Tarenaya hassleriana]
MAKAVSIFSVFLVVLLVAALEVPKTGAEDRSCKSVYKGPASTRDLCPSVTIVPSNCHERCISDVGAKSGTCERTNSPIPRVRCVCDHCNNPYECTRDYQGKWNPTYICSSFPPDACSGLCIRDNNAQSGKCNLIGHYEIVCQCTFNFCNLGQNLGLKNIVGSNAV